MSTEEFVPYTYLLQWGDGTKYYGVRYSRGCHPSDLLTTYFSSSKYVKAKIQKCGLPRGKIHKTFPGNRQAAIQYENRVLRILRCPDRAEYLNKTYNRAIPVEYNGSAARKGMSYEQIYGTEEASRLRTLRSESNRKRKRTKWSDSSREAKSVAMVGEGNHMAKSVCLTYDAQQYIFSTIKHAALFLTQATHFSLTACTCAIRSKLYGKGTTKRRSTKLLYESFECHVVE